MRCSTVGCKRTELTHVVLHENYGPEPVCAPCALYYIKFARFSDHPYTVEEVSS